MEIRVVNRNKNMQVDIFQGKVIFQGNWKSDREILEICLRVWMILQKGGIYIFERFYVIDV